MYRVKWLAKNAKRRFADILNWDLMSEKYHVLVANYTLLILYTTLESTFVNTLLYTVLNDISIVILYRGISYLSTAVMMHIAAYISQKKTPTLVIRLGAFFYMCTYLLLFTGLNHMGEVMVFTAILSGTGGAFYWSAHTQLVPHYTTKSNRDTGIAILGIVQGVMTLLVPVVSGFVIKGLSGTNGYRVMFGVGVLAVAAQLYVQRNLAPVAQKKHVSQAKLAFKLLRKKRTFQLMMGYEVIRGFRDGTFAFIMNMVLFEIITDESLVGINTFLTGLASIVGSWVYGRLVKPSMRGQITIAVTAVLAACCIPLFSMLNVGTVMVFSLVSAFLTLFIVNSCSNTTYDVLGQNETTRKCMGEAAAIREGALCFGRLSGLAVLYFLPRGQQGYVRAILILTASQFISGILMWLTQRTLNRKKNAPTARKAGETV